MRLQKGPVVRVGVPVTGGQLVSAARVQRFPVLFSANAFARTYGQGHERGGDFRSFRLPNLDQFAGLDAALDSAGFVAAVRYGDYRWSVKEYFDLVESFPWAWYASMDYCCEPEISGDRSLRLLRIAATCFMYGECPKEARLRNLPMPMPVLQGWTPLEYVECARWMPLLQWPALIGIGSVCRRPVHGPTGILAILEAIDGILPAHVKLHLFGVKSSALDYLAHHPRVASVDSMAWDVSARAERRTGRDMAFRIGHMQAWSQRQQRIVEKGRPTGAQSLLFDPEELGGFTGVEETILEVLTLRYADLIMSGDLEYRAAVSFCQLDGIHALATYRNAGKCADVYDDLNDLMAGLGDEVAARS